MNEFSTLCNTGSGGENITTLVTDMTGALILVVGLGSVNLGLLSPHTTAVLGGTFFLLYLLYLTIRLVMQLYNHENSPLANLAYSYMGQLYIALPLGILSMYYTLPDGKASYAGDVRNDMAERYGRICHRLAHRTPQTVSAHISGQDMGGIFRRYYICCRIGPRHEILLPHIF